MKTILAQLWNDQDGVIVTSEIILIGTILVLGSIAGLTSLQYAIAGELNDCANAVHNSNTAQYLDANGNAYNSGNSPWQMNDAEGKREVVGQYRL